MYETITQDTEGRERKREKGKGKSGKKTKRGKSKKEKGSRLELVRRNGSAAFSPDKFDNENRVRHFILRFFILSS